MQTKVVITILGVTLVLVTVILGAYLRFKKEIVVPQVIQVELPTSILVEETSTWDDPAQFSFQYPKSLLLNPHTEDQDNYAHVELTSAAHSGNLIIWVKDTTADTIDKWIIQGKIENAIDSNIAGISAKKVLITGDINKLTISAIRGGYLYQIETDLVGLPVHADSDYWNKTLDTVLSSFKFTSTEKSATQEKSVTSNNEQVPDTSSNEEEVIE